MPRAIIRRPEGLILDASPDLMLPEDRILLWCEDEYPLYRTREYNEEVEARENEKAEQVLEIEISDSLAETIRVFHRLSADLENSEELTRFMTSPSTPTSL